MKIVYTFKPFYSAQRVTVQKVEVFWLMAAKDKWLSGNLTEARNILDEALQNNPTSEALWQAAGKLEWESDEPKEHALASRRLELPYHHVPGYG